MHYVLQCMDFLQWADDRDTLLEDIEEWCKWSFKRCSVLYETLRSPIIRVLKRIETLACTGPQQHISSFAIWSRVIRRAMCQDIEDFEKSVILVIRSQDLTPSSFDFWEVRTFMDLLLTVRILIFQSVAARLRFLLFNDQ